MIVVDVNIVAYLLIDGDHTKSAHQLYQKDNHWRLPALWRYEFLNILSTYVRFGGAEHDAANNILDHAIQMFYPAESEPDYQKVLQLSIEENISAYDAQYVALAKELKVPLITADQNLVSAVPSHCVNMTDYIA